MRICLFLCRDDAAGPFIKLGPFLLLIHALVGHCCSANLCKIAICDLKSVDSLYSLCLEWHCLCLCLMPASGAADILVEDSGSSSNSLLSTVLRAALAQELVAA